MAHVSRQEQIQREVQRIATLPVVHEHAAGIDVGDRSHWVCVGVTPDGSDPIREIPSHTQGLRDLVAWLRQCGVTTVALEASGVYGHVLFLHLLEAKFEVIVTAPQFARQIQGRPKTDTRNHSGGLLRRWTSWATSFSHSPIVASFDQKPCPR